MADPYQSSSSVANRLPPNPPPHEQTSDSAQKVQRTKTLNKVQKMSRFFKKPGSKDHGNGSDGSNDHKAHDESCPPSSLSNHSQPRPFDRVSIPSSVQDNYCDTNGWPISRTTSYLSESSYTREGNMLDGRPGSALNEVEEEYAATNEISQLMRELEEVKLAVERMRKDVVVEAERRQALQQTYEEIKRQLQNEEKEYSQIENQFFSQTRSVKATDDDLSTIRDTFKLLKYSIARMIMTLNKKADFERAQQKFVDNWPALCRVGELEAAHMNLLAEKLVHDHLVLHIFRCPIHPGLEINDAYKSVSDWLTAHGSDFAIRLRQQLACIVAKSARDSGLQQASQNAKKEVIELIYNDLADIYHPYIRENDDIVSEDKRYYTKITDIVDKTTKLAVAIRGQDVDITTLDIKEGEAQFDSELMVDVKGKTKGTVRFCISPPFVGGDGEHGFIEKGKVVVS